MSDRRPFFTPRVYFRGRLLSVVVQAVAFVGRDAEPFGNLSCGLTLIEAVDVGKQRDQVATFDGDGEVRPLARLPIDLEGAERPIVAGGVQGNIFAAFESAAGQPLVQQRLGARQSSGGDTLEVYGRVARVHSVVSIVHYSPP